MDIVDILNSIVALGTTKLIIISLVICSVIGSIIGLCFDVYGKTKYVFLLIISLLFGLFYCTYC